MEINSFRPNATRGYVAYASKNNIQVRYGNNVPLQHAEVPSECPLNKESKQNKRKGLPVELLLRPIPLAARRNKQTHALLGIVSYLHCPNCAYAENCIPYVAYINNTQERQDTIDLGNGAHHTLAMAKNQEEILEITFSDVKRKAKCEAPDDCLLSEQPTPVEIVYQDPNKAFKTQTYFPPRTVIGVNSLVCETCPQQDGCGLVQNYNIYTNGKEIITNEIIVEPVQINHRAHIEGEGKGKGAAHRSENTATQNSILPPWINKLANYLKNFRKRR